MKRQSRVNVVVKMFIPIVRVVIKQRVSVVSIYLWCRAIKILSCCNESVSQRTCRGDDAARQASKHCLQGLSIKLTLCSRDTRCFEAVEGIANTCASHTAVDMQAKDQGQEEKRQ
jgi:hypothetical protein